MTPEEVQAELDAAKADKDRLTAERADYVTQYKAATQQLDAAKAEVTDLQAQVVAAQAAVDQGQADATRLAGEITSRKAQIDELTAQIAALQKELDDMAAAGGPVGVSMGNWIVNDDAQRRSDIAAMKDTGFTWIRHGINWSGSEKPAGTIQTWTANQVGTAMKDAGMNWLVILAYTPLFYSSGSTDKYPPKPEFYDEWQQWVETQIRAVKATGCKFAVEIWNEENHVAFFGWPDPKVYVQLLKRARAAIRKVDPNIQIVFGGMAPAPDRPAKGTTPPSYRSSTFVKECYAAGMTGDDFDAMNFHPYNGQQPLSATAGKPWDMNTTVYNELLAEMAKHGDGQKKVWATEFGYGTETTHNAPGVTEAQQATLLVDQIKFLRTRPSAGVSFVFNWREMSNPPGSTQFGSYGIVRFNRTPKPAQVAIKKYLTGS